MREGKDGAGAIGHRVPVHAHFRTLYKPVCDIAGFGLLALARSISTEGEGRIRSFPASNGCLPPALNQIPARAKQRGISEAAVVTYVMRGKSRTKEMMPPVDAANPFLFGFSRFSKYLDGGELLFEGGMVRTV